MSGVKLIDLTPSASPTATQSLLLFDEATNDAQRINYNTLADVILNKLTSKKYSITGTSQDLISAISGIKTVTHPDITDVLTPASDVTINQSYVSIRNNLMILDCNFSQTSTTKIDRFTFKTGYKPIVLNANISPIFMYSNNVVSDSVLFANPSTLTIFGANPIANQNYYFRLICFI